MDEIERLRIELNKLDEHNISAHKEMYERLGKLENQSPKTEFQLTQILKMLEKMETDINSLKDKPARRWESLVAVIISCIATGAITFLITKLLGG